VASRIIKCAKQFIAPTLFPTALHQLGQKNSHRVVVGNRKPMRMLSHDRTSIFQIVFVLAPPISSISKSFRGFTVLSREWSLFALFELACGLNQAYTLREFSR
jgi:hypothetical protein